MISGIVWMLMASLAFTLMSVCVKAASDVASSWQAVFFRSVVGLPFLVLLVLRNEIPILGTRSWLLVARSILGFTALCLYFFSLTLIPIGNASILNATSPLFVMVLSSRIPGERVPKVIFWLIPFFLLGVSFVVKPQASHHLAPHLAALGSGFFGSLAYISVRSLSKTESSTTIVLYFTTIASIASIPMAVLDWRPLTTSATMLLIASGMFATIGQLTMTRAYKMERAGIVSMFTYSGPIYAYLAGLFLFHEMPDIWAVAGTAIVIGCGVLVYRFKGEDETVSPRSYS